MNILLPGVTFQNPGYRGGEYGYAPYNNSLSINGDSRVVVLVDGRRVDNATSTRFGSSNASGTRTMVDLNQVVNINNVEKIEVILKPSEGKILFNGKNIDELSFRQTALDLAVVAQHNFYNFDFKVLDVVLMGRSPHKKILERDNEIDYKIARNALEKVGLKDFVERNFTTLSGGEQQRVILARALTQETECLVLDEPTNHLDIKYQLQIMDIVKSLNLTVIAAIHDLNIAAMYCDRLVALKDGQIVGAGKPKDLLTEKFIKDLYEVDTKIEALPNDNINIRFLPKHFK